MEENDGNGASSVSRSSDNGSFGSSPSRSEQWQRVLSRPPWILDLLLAFQHVLVLSAALRASFLPLMSPTSPCPSPSLMCTSFLCSGLATLLQLILGSRLPLLHGGSLVAHVPLASITRRSWNDVLDGVETRHWNIANVTSQHVLDTSGELGAALLIAGIVQVVLGIAAMAGRVSDVCGPLVLAPAISLLGLAGYQQSATFSGEHWGLATGTITLMLTCSQYLGGVYVPLPRCLSACSIRLPLLRLFSVLLPAGLVWILCIALQVQSLPIRPANLSADCTSAADGATWLQVPSSGRRGAPVFSADAVSCGLTLAILASMETLGCEVLASRLLHCPVPPQHTLSRGLSVQGATTMMAGALSCPAVGVASLPNTCALGLTQEGSRLSVFLASALCILLGLSPRLTLFLTTLPTPAVGGLLCVTHSFAVAAGISYFQYLDIDSGRNIFIVGFSLFMALLLPCWLQRHTSGSCTGVPWLDIALHGLLMTPAFLGGFLAFCLDHTVSGTLDERGLMQASTGEPCTDTARNGRPDVLAPPCRFRHFCRGMCPLLKRPSDRGSTSVQFPELDSLTRPTLRISHTDMETSI